MIKNCLKSNGLVFTYFLYILNRWSHSSTVGDFSDGFAGSPLNGENPIFSKPNDERVPKENWNIYKGRPDIILFDAWCGGVPPESKDSWDGPINSLEESEDPNGVWWKWSNDALRGSYQELFSLFDILIMIKVPDIQTVFDSRWLQEQTLSKHLVGTKDEHKIMNREEVDRFVMHYERLTLHILKEVPAIADIVIKRDRNFQFIYSKTPR